MKYLKHYIIEKNKEAVIVTDEGEFPIWIKDFEKSFSSLMSGDEILDSERLTALALRRHIKKKAIRRLTSSDITKKSLKYILLRERAYGGVPEEEWVDSLLDKLENAGYIDDNGFAVRYMQKCLEKSWGDMKIRASMSEKGFSDDAYEQALEKLCPDFTEIALDYIKKALNGCERDTVYRKLYQRGFQSDDIISAIERNKDE